MHPGLETPGSAATPDESDRAARHAAIAWCATAGVAAVLCFTQAGMMVCLMLGRAGVRAVAPLAIIGALLCGDVLARNTGLRGRQRLWPALLALGAVGASVVFAACYFDLSWDGQWYHQTGIYAIARDWNPVTEPMRPFLEHLELWVRHYAKGPWYVAAAVQQTTGQIEWGKFPAVLALFASGLAVFAAGLDCGLRRGRAAGIACLVAMNPVILSELTTFLVDGIMVGFLVVAVAALFGGLRRPRAVVVWAGIFAALVAINAKFTGLVFLCFALAAGWLWCVGQRRTWLPRYTAISVATILGGAGVLGYNPYVTNLLHRGHLFYPVLGTAAYPSLTDQGREGIELYETPKNVMGRSRWVRLAYATFGRPGNAPYGKADAELMRPFTVRWGDLFAYRYHETRVAGFGPLFSGALVLAAALTLWRLWDGPRRWLMSLVGLTVMGSLLISLHLWWPRYGPQLWLLAIVPLAFTFSAARSRPMMGAAWTLLVLLLMNALVVGAVRVHWETKASRTLRAQLTALRDSHQTVEVALQYFEIPVGERLRAWGIPFENRPEEQLRDGQELMSVVEGYPAAVRYREPSRRGVR